MAAQNPVGGAKPTAGPTRGPQGASGQASVQAQNRRGDWVPGIPEPLFVGFGLRRCRCDCRRTFRNRETYRGHYALVHILALS